MISFVWKFIKDINSDSFIILYMDYRLCVTEWKALKEICKLILKKTKYLQM